MVNFKEILVFSLLIGVGIPLGATVSGLLMQVIAELLF